MTDQERQQAMLKALDELCNRYGYQIVSTVTTRQLGPLIQIEPSAPRLEPVPGWTPPDEKPTKK